MDIRIVGTAICLDCGRDLQLVRPSLFAEKWSGECLCGSFFLDPLGLPKATVTVPPAWVDSEERA